MRLMLAAIAFSIGASFAQAEESRPSVIVVVGAEGTKEFGDQFRQWAARWEAAAKQGQAGFAAIGLDDAREKTDRDLLRQRLADVKGPALEAVWLVLIGHGTFDGKTGSGMIRLERVGGWVHALTGVGDIFFKLVPTNFAGDLHVNVTISRVGRRRCSRS